MARPKNTKTTKWLIHHETWYGTRKEAVAMGKHSLLPYDVEHKPDAKTYYGSYRRATFRLRTYIPKVHRGHKVTTGPIRYFFRARQMRKYHKGETLVKIQGGSYIFLDPALSIRPKKRRSARATRR